MLRAIIALLELLTQLNSLVQQAPIPLSQTTRLSVSVQAVLQDSFAWLLHLSLQGHAPLVFTAHKVPQLLQQSHVLLEPINPLLVLELLGSA